MSAAPTPGTTGAALDSVRELERALEAGSTVRAEAEARLDAARAEAARILDAAHERAAAATAACRRGALAAADRDASAILAEAEAGAAQLRAEDSAGRRAAVEASLALILPPGEEDEA